MGVIDKFLDVMKLGDDYEDDYDDDYDDYDDDYEDEKPEKKGLFKRKRDDGYEDDYDDEPIKSKSSKVTPMRSPRKSGSMEVCVIKPITFEDSREITETLLSNRTVVFLVTPKNVDISGDLQDILSGSIDIPTTYSGYNGVI